MYILFYFKFYTSSVLVWSKMLEWLSRKAGHRQTSIFHFPNPSFRVQDLNIAIVNWKWILCTIAILCEKVRQRNVTCCAVSCDIDGLCRRAAGGVYDETGDDAGRRSCGRASHRQSLYPPPQRTAVASVPWHCHTRRLWHHCWPSVWIWFVVLYFICLYLWCLTVILN